MSEEKTKCSRIFPALQIWLFLAAAFAGCILLGGVRGPWNYYWLFTIGCWAALDIDWALAARRTKPATTSKPNRLALSLTILVYSLYCLPLSSVPLLGQRIVPHFAALEIFGAMMCAFGVGFAMWARHVLADSWNAGVTQKEGDAFVRHGPYAIVRHPIYFGLLVAVVGMILVLGEVRAFALLFGVEILLKKMGQEESILRAKFPGDYPRYERCVKRLLPWIW